MWHTGGLYVANKELKVCGTWGQSYILTPNWLIPKISRWSCSQVAVDMFGGGTSADPEIHPGENYSQRQTGKWIPAYFPVMNSSKTVSIKLQFDWYFSQYCIFNTMIGIIRKLCLLIFAMIPHCNGHVIMECTCTIVQMSRSNSEVKLYLP